MSDDTFTDTFIDARCIRPRLNKTLLHAFEALYRRPSYRGVELVTLITVFRGALIPEGHSKQAIDGIIAAMFAELDERNISLEGGGPRVPMVCVYPYLTVREHRICHRYDARFKCQDDVRKLHYAVLRQDSLAVPSLLASILQKLSIAIEAFDAGLEVAR